MMLNKNIIWIILAIIFLLIGLGIYVNRINIYTHIEIEIVASEITKDDIPEVVLISPLYRKKILFPDDTGLFVVKTGYYNKIIINETENILFIVLRFDNDSIVIRNDSGLSKDGSIIIDKLHETNCFTKIKSLVGVNANYIIIALSMFFFLLFSLYYRGNNYLKIYNNLLFSVIITYMLYWLVLASLFTFPNAEDFSLVLNSINTNPLKATKFMLIDYDARYTANFMYGINIFAFFGIEFYKYIPIFSIILFISSFYFLLKSLFGNAISRKHIITLAVGISILHLIGAPSIVHHIYWMSSSFVYYYIWIVAFLWVAFAVRILKSKSRKTIVINYIVCIILLFLSFGVNEMSLPLNLFLLIVLLLYASKYQSYKRHYFVNLLIIGLLISVFVFFIPGNLNRLEYGGLERDSIFYANAIVFSLKVFFHEICSFIVLQPINLLASFLIIFLLLKSKIGRIICLIKVKTLIMCSIGFIITLYVMSLAYYIPAGDTEGIPERVNNTLHFGFIVSFCILLPVIILNTRVKVFLQKINHSQAIGLGLIMIIVILSFMKNNISLIKTEFDSGLLHLHKSEMQTRFSTLKEATCMKKYKIAVIKNAEAKPSAIYIEPDIAENRKLELWNTAYEGYFKIDEVRIENDSITKSQIIGNYAQ